MRLKGKEVGNDIKNAYIIDAIRTPFGRYAGGLAPSVPMTLALCRLKHSCSVTQVWVGTGR